MLKAVYVPGNLYCEVHSLLEIHRREFIRLILFEMRYQCRYWDLPALSNVTELTSIISSSIILLQLQLWQARSHMLSNRLL